MIAARYAHSMPIPATTARTAKAFETAGLPVPADRHQWNIYRATGCKGELGSPEIDHHVERFGAEYLPGRPRVCADCDQQLAVGNRLGGRAAVAGRSGRG